MIKNEYEPVDLYNKYSLKDDAETSGVNVRKYLGIEYKRSHNPTKYLNYLRSLLEDYNVIVEISKVVKQTQHRLDVNEFRGFALADKYSSLIFVNGNDSVRAQIFTLCHELGHICLGLEGLSDVNQDSKFSSEVWCNKFAAGLLMPANDFMEDYSLNKSSLDGFIELASDKYQVSAVSILFRLLNLKLVSKEDFEYRYQTLCSYCHSSTDDKKEKSGGNFYSTFKSRSSSILSKAILSSAMVGDTPFRDAMDLLGIKSIHAFNKMAKSYEVN